MANTLGTASGRPCGGREGGPLLAKEVSTTGSMGGVRKGRPVSRVKADHTFGLRSKEPVPSSSNQPGSSSATSYVTSTRIRPGASRLSLRRPKLLLQKMASGSFNIIGLRETAGPSD